MDDQQCACCELPGRWYSYSPDKRVMGNTLEKPQRLAADTGRKTRLVPLAGNVDDVYRAVALAPNEQFVVTERRVHRLGADPDRGLPDKRRVDQADGVASMNAASYRSAFDLPLSSHARRSAVPRNRPM